MNCCNGTIAMDGAAAAQDASTLLRTEELAHAGHVQADGTVQYVLSVPGIHCGRCISAIETELQPLAGVVSARVNMTLRRVSVVLDSEMRSPADLLATLDRIGYPATPVDMGDLSDLERGRETRQILIAMAVAGFAAGNIMLFSVSVWSGATDVTRDFFHLLSALLAIPAVGYSGRIFFRSAIQALSARRLNMDVPISLAILLALGMSLFETMTGGAEAYFDAAVSLLFFLLIGRYLDHLMRDRARGAVVGLARLAVKGATRLEVDGSLNYVPVDEVRPGMVLRVPAGERMPVDGRIVGGESDLDRALVTGESAPVHVGPGMDVEAGSLNISGAVDIEATRTADDSFLAEVTRMLQAAEQGRSNYVRIADRMARIYAPAVHLLAFAAFVGWMIETGGDWHLSIYTAIAVLIITCPCALGLAVPVVHVIGATRLFEAGILMKDGSALERLAEADHVAFDKTGTLTTGMPRISESDIDGDRRRAVLAAMAGRSSHPVSRAVAAWATVAPASDLRDVREVPGQGIQAMLGDGRQVRLGRREWVGEIANGQVSTPMDDSRSAVSFAVAGAPLSRLVLEETLRADAEAAVADLKTAGLPVEILSGDAEGPVARLAARLGIDRFTAGMKPADKIARIEGLRDTGARVLMVGDGLNDAPSLAAGHVSMAPSTASDVGRMAADFVMTRDSLSAVPFARGVALKAGRLVRLNFGLAIVYNCIAVPLALAGLVTPLFAAVAMSASSIVVVVNSMRLLRYGKPALFGGGRSAERQEPVAGKDQGQGSKQVGDVAWTS